MQEQAKRLQRGVSYALITIGIIGMGFLTYLVIDNLSTNEVVTLSENETEEIHSDDVAADQEVVSNVPIGISVGQRAPDFHLLSLDNEVVALSDFLGRIVILDFWASWCVPCQLTLPGLETIARSLAPDVVLVGVSLDRNAENAANYLATNKFDNMIALYESYASAYAVFQMYGGGGIPKTFIIDQQGVIRFVGHPAQLSQQTIEELL